MKFTLQEKNLMLVSLDHLHEHLLSLDGDVNIDIDSKLNIIEILKDKLDRC
tara:strand:+ start:4271 stop:4423 length:153 start_codon:yes stop_codon:yes gene_type:complete